MESIKTIIAQYADELIEKCETAKTIKIPPPKTVHINTIQKYTLKKFSADFSELGEKIAYIIGADEIPFIRDEIKAKFKAIKKA